MHRHNTEREAKAPVSHQLKCEENTQYPSWSQSFFLSSCLPLFFPPYSVYFHRSRKPWKQPGFLSCCQQSQSFLPPSFLCFLLDSNSSLTGCCHLSYCWLQALQHNFSDVVLGLVKSWIMRKAWNAKGISTRIDFCSLNFSDKKHLFCNHHEILLFHSSLPKYSHSTELYLSSGFLYSGLNSKWCRKLNSLWTIFPLSWWNDDHEPQQMVWSLRLVGSSCSPSPSITVKHTAWLWLQKQSLVMIHQKVFDEWMTKVNRTW